LKKQSMNPKPRIAPAGRQGPKPHGLSPVQFPGTAGGGMSKRPTAKLPPFVAMTWEMLNHPAYIELPASAKGMLPYFIGKVRASVRDTVHYSTSFIFPYSEAERYGCSRHTFFRVLESLVRHGFLDPVERGGLRGTGLTTSTFRLSPRWKKYGTADYQEITWRQFGEKQIHRQVQKWHRNSAKNALVGDQDNA